MRTGNPTVKSHDSTLIQLNSGRSPPLSRHQLREIAKSPPLRTGTYGPGSSLHQKKSTDQVTHIFIGRLLLQEFNKQFQWSNHVKSNVKWLTGDLFIPLFAALQSNCTFRRTDIHESPINRTVPWNLLPCVRVQPRDEWHCNAPWICPQLRKEGEGPVWHRPHVTIKENDRLSAHSICYLPLTVYPLVCSPFFSIKTNNMCKNCQGVFLGIRAVVRRRPSLRQPLVASSGWGQQQVLGGWCEAWRGSLDSAASSP